MKRTNLVERAADFVRGSKARDITVVGPSRSGKTTMLAALYLSAVSESAAVANEAIDSLAQELLEERRVRGTQLDEVVPLQFQLEQGGWVSQKTTVRTLDYAGENVSSIEPPKTEDETATGSIDEAMDVALRLAWEDPNLDLVEKTGDEKGIDPAEYEQLETKNANYEIAIELVQDVLYYSDMAAFVLPLDDFADPLVQRGTTPDYLRTASGGIDSISGRDSVSEYKRKYNDIARTYGVGGQDDDYDGNVKDMFFVTTFADVAAKEFESEHGSHPAAQWDAFTDHVSHQLIGDELMIAQNHIGNHDPYTDIHPVYLEPIDDQATDWADIEFDVRPGERLPLRGATELLERMGG